LSWVLSFFDHPISRECWDSQYLSGQWNRLRQLDELAHYSIIVGYFVFLKHGGSILDLGCGEGLLQERLSPNTYSKYVGIDISEAAINLALHKQDKKTSFVRGDANDYIFRESFDVIIINESLVYLDNPIELLKRLEHYLKEDGLFIISMYLDSRTKSIWKRLESLFHILDETKVTNRTGSSWICKVFTRSDNQDMK